MGETLAVDGAGVVAVVLVIVLLAGVGIAGRRTLLEHGGGTVECGLRRPAGDGSWPAWRLGVARYRRDELFWHQIFGVRLRPDEILARSSLTVLSRRRPVPAEINSLGPDAVIVRCTANGAAGTGGLPDTNEARDPASAAGAADGAAGQVELAMGEAAMTGFLAWLEAAPRDPYRRGLPPGVPLVPPAPRAPRFNALRPASIARRRDRRSPAGRG